MKLFLVAICVAIAAARPPSEWFKWKATHSKHYETEQEEMDRFEIWSTNMAYIDDHNARGLGFELEINQFGDMTDYEFRTTILANMESPVKQSNRSVYTRQGIELPNDVDWRTHNYVTGVKNQGSCGSCWAFSATGSLEGQHAKKTGNLVSLSEQNLVDCSTAEGNQGCKGGLMDRAFEYIERNHGIDTEESYPYTAKDGFCHFRESDVGATLISYTDVEHQDEQALQEVSATVGPISVAMDAGHTSFRFYKRGVYYEPECSSTKLNHGVLVVGYGSLEMEDYWLGKNSWGLSWGNEGYFMIARNRNNNCGIATQASYPRV